MNILKDVSIQGIPEIYDIEEDEDFYYIIEEYIDGYSFVEYIDEKILEITDFAECICQICDILINLHNLEPYAVIHNDIKPDNFMVKDKRVYLIDFGNCIICKDESDNQKRRLMASASNVTPEHVRGEKLDVRTDVYAIGMLIQYIYQKKKSLFKEDSVWLRNIIDGCLEREGDNRIQSPLIIKKYFCDIKEKAESDVKHINGIKISVCGCRSHSGVTHFSSGFVKYLSDIHKNAVYIESSEEGGISEYFKEYRKRGFYTYEGCKIFPYYGDFIEENDNPVMEKRYDFEGIRIYDMGEYRGEFDIENDIIIMLITDRKCFGEINYDVIKKGFNAVDDKKYIFNESLVDNILYVVNFSDIEGYKKLDRSIRENVIYMPYFPNPFNQNKDIKKFYDKVYKSIVGMLKST